jgi:hypothetical protein
MGRPSMKILAGIPLLPAIKWCVPNGGIKTDDGVSISVEKT